MCMAQTAITIMTMIIMDIRTPMKKSAETIPVPVTAAKNTRSAAEQHEDCTVGRPL